MRQNLIWSWTDGQPDPNWLYIEIEPGEEPYVLAWDRQTEGTPARVWNGDAVRVRLRTCIASPIDVERFVVDNKDVIRAIQCAIQDGDKEALYAREHDLHEASAEFDWDYRLEDARNWIDGAYHDEVEAFKRLGRDKYEAALRNAAEDEGVVLVGVSKLLDKMDEDIKSRGEEE